MKFVPTEPEAPLDTASPLMLNAPFTGAGVEPDCRGMRAGRHAPLVYSNEEYPTHGKSADA